MQLTASDLITCYRPSECGLRVYLRQSGEPEDKSDPYAEVLLKLGERHEKEHLASLSGVTDLSHGSKEERLWKTQQAINAGANVLYQPLFSAQVQFNGATHEVSGEPDFLITNDGGYLIRDSKISRRINEKDHPEILLQLDLYGWLYEQVTGKPPTGLEVHSGTGDIVPVAYTNGRTAMDALREVCRLSQLRTEPYSPVGWSKCNGCPFNSRCWKKAKDTDDVAMVFGVEQALAISLRKNGTATISQLLTAFKEDSLAEFKLQRKGGKLQRVGKKASEILRMATAMNTGREYPVGPLSIPVHANYAMLDLEGLPPYLDELDKIYLWGIKVFGEKPSDFMPAVSEFGPEGDRQGWEQFLNNAKRVLSSSGDIPFVHWTHYEKGHIKKYIERYGDPEGTAAGVLANLLDLHPITKNAVALPIPSYSLKAVEKHIGFKRSLDEYGGTWSMAKYIEASETNDETLRSQVMDKILAYNQEDLEATWAVMEWLKSKS